MTPRTLVPAVKLWPDGKRQQGRGQPERLDTPDAARAKLALGACAVVKSDDLMTLIACEVARRDPE